MTTKIPRISAKFYTTLSKKVNVADTTATLSLATDLDGDVLPSGRYGFTIDEGNSSVEYVEADLVATALTNIKRLDPTTLVETTGFVKEHRAGAEVKITDFTVLGRIRNVILGIEDLDDGAPIKYGASPSLSDPLMLATVEYVLSVVNGGAVTFDTQIIAGIAGESISSGQWVYFKESDGRWYLTDANTQSTVKNVRIGMAKGAGTTGNAISGGIFVGGLEKTGTYVAGNTYYLSNTAGALSTTAGEFEALVGIADANGELLFLNIYDPEGTTPEEKDALTGTVGTPNINNKFVTENNSTTAGTDQSQTTQDSTVEVGSADATTQKNKIAQSFIPTKNKIRGVTLYKSADTGTFAGTVTVTLQADSAGSPSGSALATKVFTNGQWANEDVGEIEALFATEYTSLVCVPATTYWIVVESSTADNSNHPNLGFNTAGGYANGTLKYNNTTDGWVEISGDDLYFKTLEGIKNQVVKTDTEGHIPENLLRASKMPIPAFLQFLTTELTTYFLRSACSNQSGSILIIYNDSNSEFIKFERDEITGTFLQTSANGLGTTPNADGYPVIHGDYVYLFYDAGATMGCYRYNLSNLGSETLMTVPSIATTSSGEGSIMAYSDGLYIYFYSGSQNTTLYTLSVSGTTISQVTTSTLDNDLDANDIKAVFFDGTTVYMAKYVSGTITIYKLVEVTGTSNPSATTKIVNPYSDDDTGLIIMNIDTERMYIGRLTSEYDETGQVVQKVYLIPITKP